MGLYLFQLPKGPMGSKIFTLPREPFVTLFSPSKWTPVLTWFTSTKVTSELLFFPGLRTTSLITFIFSAHLFPLQKKTSLLFNILPFKRGLLGLHPFPNKDFRQQLFRNCQRISGLAAFSNAKTAYNHTNRTIKNKFLPDEINEIKIVYIRTFADNRLNVITDKICL